MSVRSMRARAHKILVADDEKGMREFLAILLRKEQNYYRLLEEMKGQGVTEMAAIIAVAEQRGIEVVLQDLGDFDRFQGPRAPAIVEQVLIACSVRPHVGSEFFAQWRK